MLSKNNIYAQLGQNRTKTIEVLTLKVPLATHLCIKLCALFVPRTASGLNSALWIIEMQRHLIPLTDWVTTREYSQ